MRSTPLQTFGAARLPHTFEGTQAARYGSDETTASWQRCLDRYRINPQSNNTPDVLTAGEFNCALEPIENHLAQAREALYSLSAIVQPLGYATLIADSNGIIIDVLSIDTETSHFTNNGTRAGGIWSEEKEGTNGIGTCLYARQPLTVRRDQHFRTRHKIFSCSGAPIFDWRGQPAMVLCLAGYDNNTADSAFAMTLAITVAWAGMIEERLFRDHFRSCWIIAMAPTNGGSQGVLLALDPEHRIVGADRHGRSQFALNDRDLEVGTSAWSRFDRASSTCKWIKSGDDTPVQFTCSGDASIWHGLATPPAGRLAGVSKSITGNLHTRPRLALLHNLPQADSKAVLRGGLSAVTCRRVLDYIENNLNIPIHVNALAAEAGLSLHHFTREFARTVGEAPHAYLLRRRLEKSVELIENTNRPLAEIALAVGFSDQSHFTRRFARHVGMTPGAFRRTRGIGKSRRIPR